MKKTASSVKRIKIRDLRRLTERYDHAFPNVPDLIRAHGIALGILRHYFGRDWAAHNLQPKGFLPPRTDVVSTHANLSRTIQLAEMIFNLRDVRGIESVIEQIRGGQLESAYAELEVGKTLSGFGIQFNFVIPHGKRGDDYDVELYFPSGERGCSDTKCKIDEGEIFNPKSVKNTLDKARGQLSNSLPGVLFVKIPHRWLANPEKSVKVYLQKEVPQQPNIVDRLMDVAKTALRGTRRIVCIVFYSTSMTFENGKVILSTGGIEVANENHRFDKSKSWKLLLDRRNRLAVQPPNWWVSLVDFR